MSFTRVRSVVFVAMATAVLLGAVACGGHNLYVRPGVSPVCTECLAEAAELDTRVLLIGDTGELEPGNPTLDLLVESARGVESRTLAIFLGDNIYPRGMPDPDEDEAAEERVVAEQILQLQIDAVARAGVPGVFVPGNHDWDRSGVRGLGRILAQDDYLEASGADVRLLPEAGCPGPVYMDLGERARVIHVDSEWLLRPDHPKLTDCTWGPVNAQEPLVSGDDEAVYAALASAVTGAGDRRVLLATHHPLKTRGSHGGFFTAKQFFFPLTFVRDWLFVPLPIIYPPLRYWVVRSDQDIYGSRNREMVERMEAALIQADAPAIVASGHEHTLQVFDDPELPIWYLVSGSGAKEEPTGKSDDTLFKHAAPGIMVVDFFRDGRVSVRVLEPGDGSPAGSEVFAHWLR